MSLCILTEKIEFPSPEQAFKEPNGLLAVGGDLSSARLIEAYFNGIFPWFNPEEPILWWSPNPRAVIYLDRLHVSRSLKKFLRQNPYRITLNHNFSGVINECAKMRANETWISKEMRFAYIDLHKRGIAHSIEVWQGNELIGGLYGVAPGKIFCGESMFSQRDNASKCAMIALCQHLTAYGFALIDSQIINSHTASMGAVEIPRDDYLTLLKNFRGIQPDNRCWNEQELVIHQENRI